MSSLPLLEVMNFFFFSGERKRIEDLLNSISDEDDGEGLFVWVPELCLLVGCCSVPTCTVACLCDLYVCLPTCTCSAIQNAIGCDLSC